jgi:choice-of-anchor C domain-containing protein
MKFRSLSFLAGPLLCAFPAHGANIIDSIYGVGAGSFEIPDPNIPTYENLAAGSTDLYGWTVGAGSVDWVRNTVWNASQGNYSIDMNGTAPGGDPPSVGSISTMIQTTIGTTYRVSFDISGFLGFGNPTNPKDLELSVKAIDLLNMATEISNSSHQFVATNTSTVLPLALNWQTRTVTFVATESQTSVTFTSKTTNNHSGMLLDNVNIETVQLVPEPSAAALGSIAAFVLLRRRRR